jgi:hypothetical protein
VSNRSLVREEPPVNVSLLWRVDELAEGDEDATRIGVHSHATEPEAVRLRALAQTSFHESPEGYEVSRYEVGEHEWDDGCITAEISGGQELSRIEVIARAIQWLSLMNEQCSVHGPMNSGSKNADLKHNS